MQASLPSVVLTGSLGSGGVKTTPLPGPSAQARGTGPAHASITSPAISRHENRRFWAGLTLTGRTTTQLTASVGVPGDHSARAVTRPEQAPARSEEINTTSTGVSRQTSPPGPSVAEDGPGVAFRSGSEAEKVG